MRVNLAHFVEHKENFLVIDIRKTQSFLRVHIQDSINLQSIDEIVKFLQGYDFEKTPILFCFTSKRAEDFALKVAQFFVQKIAFLDAGIFEVESSLPLVESGVSSVENLQAENKVSQDNKKAKKLEFQNFATKTREAIKEKYLKTNKTFVVAFSGGKDSTCVLQLVYEMLLSLPKESLRQTYAIASNTLIEAPHIKNFLKSIINSINTHAKLHKIPFKVLEVCPEISDDFWVNLIGKGYPSPTRTFRWCTDRLKIRPAKQTIAKIVKEHGAVLLLLGVRKSESTNRKKSIEKRVLNEDGFSIHEDYPQTMIYSPIAEWNTDEVWSFLMKNPPPWQNAKPQKSKSTHDLKNGKSAKQKSQNGHKKLFELYTKASGKECQFITDLSQSSCGGSRFGCWVCTVVNEDKSMQGFIDSGEEVLRPLNRFRNYIKELRENPNARSDYGRNGSALYKVGKLGPFLSKTRIEIFRKLLECEQEFIANGGESLISNEQIIGIQQEWDRDFDFNKTALNLAKEFGKMDFENKKSELLHEEIFDEMDFSGSNLNKDDLKNLITSAIEMYATNTTSGTNNAAGKKIKEALNKLLEDKSAKE